MSPFTAIILKATAFTACITCLCGCLPDDTFLALEFSPDGKLLAIVSEKKGLVVADPAAMEMRIVATGNNIEASRIAWATDSGRLVYGASYDGSLDIYISQLDGRTTRIVSSPSRETHPMVKGDTIIFLSTESGISELTTRSIALADERKSTSTVHLPDIDQNFIEPALSLDGRYIAAFGFEHLRPQVFLIDLIEGERRQLTAESDVFGLVAGSLAWHPESRAVGYLRYGLADTGFLAESEWTPFAGSRVAAGTGFYLKQLDAEPDIETPIVRLPEGVRSACYDDEGNLVYTAGKTLKLSTPDGTVRSLDADLPAALPKPGGARGEIAFIASDQLVAITTASLEKAGTLTFDLEDKFLLAEEHFRSGSQGKSYDLYEELRASIQRTRDPEMARFVYIANLRRLGLTDKAIGEVERVLESGENLGSVPEQYLWRLLGFSYLLELDDQKKAAESLARYRELTSDTLSLDNDDSALNALQIIRENEPAVAQLYARAVKARLDGDFARTNQLFGDLLTTAPNREEVQREYINALDGFDADVYFFSPSQRPFKPTRSQRADYLERFVHLAPHSELAPRARLDLFLLRIEMGSYSRARALLNEELQTGSDDDRPAGILEVFNNYLETPEPQPWINQAMPEVFLHADIRPRLETLITQPADRLLLGVAATKAALLQNSPDMARREADAAVAEWNRIPVEEQAGEVAALYGRLLVLRAREAELRGLNAEASEAYEHAAKAMAERKADNFELQEEIRYRASLLRVLLSENTDAAARMRDIELRTGVELVNPTWDQETLKSAVQEYVQIYDTTSGTLRQWAAYEAGVLFGKLYRNQQSRAALIIAASDSAPEFLQRKAMLELAAIDEYEQDPWNAARWYSRLASFPGTPSDVRMWCSYQIARLHLSINYNIPAAREALAVIVSNRPETPLATQAQELLISTSTR